MLKFEDHYLNRITSEHKVRPKFMAWLAVLLNVLEDSAELYRSFAAEFDLETAQGKQLDIIGQIVGLGRLLDFEPTEALPLLSDEYYRMILKAKISLNQWKGTIQGIREIWNDTYSDYRLDVIDHQDMTMTLRVFNIDNTFESEIIARGYLAPKPEAVRVNYHFVAEHFSSTRLFLGAIHSVATKVEIPPVSSKDRKTSMTVRVGFTGAEYVRITVRPHDGRTERRQQTRVFASIGRTEFARITIPAYRRESDGK